MVELNIIRSEFDTEGEFQREVVAHLEADGKEVRIDGDESLLPRDRKLPNLRDGTTVSFNEDPEEWARSLPASLRGPTLAAVVVTDTNPIDEVESEEQPPSAVEYAQEARHA